MAYRHNPDEFPWGPVLAGLVAGGGILLVVKLALGGKNDSPAPVATTPSGVRVSSVPATPSTQRAATVNENLHASVATTPAPARARCTELQVADSDGRCIDLPNDFAGYYFLDPVTRAFVIPANRCLIPSLCRIEAGSAIVYRVVPGGYEIYGDRGKIGSVATLGDFPAGATPGEKFGPHIAGPLRLPRTVMASNAMGAWRTPGTTVPAGTPVRIVKFVGISSLAEIAAFADFHGYARLTVDDILRSRPVAPASGLDAIDLVMGND